MKFTTLKSDDPHLWYAAGGLYLIGNCHLRHDVRMFAVDRIRFADGHKPPLPDAPGFDVQEYVKDA